MILKWQSTMLPPLLLSPSLVICVLSLICAATAATVWQAQIDPNAVVGSPEHIASLWSQRNQFTRTRRDLNYGRGNHRGQTQSQYMNFGNVDKDGKAEAESTQHGTRASVVGSNGMGQAQSQSTGGSSSNCADCYPSGSAGGFESLNYGEPARTFDNIRGGSGGGGGGGGGRGTPATNGRDTSGQGLVQPTRGQGTGRGSGGRGQPGPGDGSYLPARLDGESGSQSPGRRPYDRFGGQPDGSLASQGFQPVDYTRIPSDSQLNGQPWQSPAPGQQAGVQPFEVRSPWRQPGSGSDGSPGSPGDGGGDAAGGGPSRNPGDGPTPTSIWRQPGSGGDGVGAGSNAPRRPGDGSGSDSSWEQPGRGGNTNHPNAGRGPSRGPSAAFPWGQPGVGGDTGAGRGGPSRRPSDGSDSGTIWRQPGVGGAERTGSDDPLWKKLSAIESPLAGQPSETKRPGWRPLAGPGSPGSENGAGAPSMGPLAQHKEPVLFNVGPRGAPSQLHGPIPTVPQASQYPQHHGTGGGGHNVITLPGNDHTIVNPNGGVTVLVGTDGPRQTVIGTDGQHIVSHGPVQVIPGTSGSAGPPRQTVYTPHGGLTVLVGTGGPHQTVNHYGSGYNIGTGSSQPSQVGIPITSSMPYHQGIPGGQQVSQQPGPGMGAYPQHPNIVSGGSDGSGGGGGGGMTMYNAGPLPSSYNLGSSQFPGSGPHSVGQQYSQPGITLGPHSTIGGTGQFPQVNYPASGGSGSVSGGVSGGGGGGGAGGGGGGGGVVGPGFLQQPTGGAPGSGSQYQGPTTSQSGQGHPVGQQLDHQYSISGSGYPGSGQYPSQINAGPATGAGINAGRPFGPGTGQPNQSGGPLYVPPSQYSGGLAPQAPVGRGQYPAQGNQFAGTGIGSQYPVGGGIGQYPAGGAGPQYPVGGGGGSVGGGSQVPAGGGGPQYPLGTGTGQYPLGGAVGQYPGGGVGSQYPVGGGGGGGGSQVPAGGGGSQYPLGGGAGQYPLGGVGSQYPVGGGGGGGGSQIPAGGDGSQYPLGGGAGQYPLGGGAGQYPAGGAAGQYPAGGAAGQYPGGGAGSQYPVGGIGGSYQVPAGGGGSQYPLGGGAGQYPGSGIASPLPGGGAGPQYPSGGVGAGVGGAIGGQGSGQQEARPGGGSGSQYPSGGAIGDSRYQNQPQYHGQGGVGGGQVPIYNQEANTGIYNTPQVTGSQLPPANLATGGGSYPGGDGSYPTTGGNNYGQQVPNTDAQYYPGGGQGHGSGTGVGQPSYASSGDGTGSGLQTPDGDDDAFSQAETAVKDGEASASAQGTKDSGTAQTQVSGTYASGGTFTANAQTSDKNRAAQAQVTGGKDGAMSSAQGTGGAAKSQAQMSVNSKSGGTSASSQTSGLNHESQSEVQANEKGGLADAQASGPGQTGSQAQIGFRPQGEETENQKNIFNGGGQASAQSGSYSGQSQSQINGNFKYGISYNGAAQAASGTKEQVNTYREKNANLFRSINEFSRSNRDLENGLDGGNVHESDVRLRKSGSNSVSTFPTQSTSLTKPDDEAEYDEEDDEYDEDEYYTSTDKSRTVEPKSGKVEDKKTTVVPKRPTVPSISLSKSLPTALGTPKSLLSTTQQPISKVNEEQPSETKIFSQTTPTQKQVAAVNKPDNKYRIVQTQNGRSLFYPPVSTTERNRQLSALNKEQVPVQQQQQQHEQQPPSPQQPIETKKLATRNLQSKHTENKIGNTIEKKPDSYVTVTKSVTGSMDDSSSPTAEVKNFESTYYTKSSTCGYFTFSCNIVYGVNGRSKICRPKTPTNGKC